jgi:hypothetical protein
MVAQTSRHAGRVLAPLEERRQDMTIVCFPLCLNVNAAALGASGSDFRESADVVDVDVLRITG